MKWCLGTDDPLTFLPNYWLWTSTSSTTLIHWWNTACSTWTRIDGWSLCSLCFTTFLFSLGMECEFIESRNIGSWNQKVDENEFALKNRPSPFSTYHKYRVYIDVFSMQDNVHSVVVLSTYNRDQNIWYEGHSFFCKISPCKRLTSFSFSKRTLSQ